MNITDSTEERWRGSSSEFDEIQLLAGIGLWEYDFINDRQWWSLGQQHLFEVHPDEVPRTMQEFLSFIHPEDRYLFNAEGMADRWMDEILEATFRIIARRSGKVKVVKSKMVPIFNEGRAIGFKGTNQDVTKELNYIDELTHANTLLAESQKIAQLGGWELDTLTNSISWLPGEFDHYEVAQAPATLEEYLQYVHPDDREIVLNSNREFFLGRREPLEIKFRIVAPSGERKTILSTIVPKFNGEKLVGLKGVTQNISERVREADMLARRTQELQQALNAKQELLDRINQVRQELEDSQRIAGVGSWSMSFQDGRITWNKGLAAIFEIPDEQLASHDLYVRHIHRDDVDQAVREFRGLRDFFQTHPDKVFYGAHRIVTGGEKVKHLKAQTIATFENGQLIGCRGVIVDVTTEKKKELELAKANEILLETQQLANIGNWAVDLRTRRLTWSTGEKAFYELAENEEPPSLDDFIRDYLTPESREELLANNGQPRPTGDGKSHRTIKVRTRTGKTRYLFSVSKPIIEDGSLIGLEGISMDVTELKEKELRIHQIKNDLVDSQRLSGTGGFYYDLTREHISYSETLQEILHNVPGVLPATFQDLLNFVHPDDAAKMDAVFSSYRTRGAKGSEDFNVRVVTVANKMKHLRVITRPQFEGDRLIGIKGVVQDITASRIAFEQLVESEERFSSVFKNSGIGKAICSSSGHIQQINAALLHLLGYQEAELVEKSIEQLVHPNDYHEFKVKWQAMFDRNHGTFQFEHRLLTKEKEIRWVISTNTLIRYSNANPVVVVQIQNITEKVNAEKQVFEYQQKFISAFHSSSVGMLIGKFDGTITEVNDAVCEFLGYSRHEILKLGVMKVSHPDDQEEDLQRLRYLITGKIKGYTIKKRYIHKTGKIVYGLLTVNMVKDAMGKPSYAIAQVQDITALEEAQLAIQEEKRKFEHLFKYSGVGMGLCDRHGRLLEVNEMLSRITGYSMEELVTMSVRDLTHPDDLELNLSELKDLTAGRLERVTQEKRYVRKDGEIRFVIVTASRITDSRSGSIFILGQIQDISELRREQNERLEIEERYRYFVDHAHVGIGFSRDAKFVYANPALLRIFEFDAMEDMSNVRWADLAAPDTRPALLKRMQDLENGKDGQEVLFGNFCTKQGKVKALEIQAKTVAIRNESYRMTIVTDLTDRMALAKKLKESEQIFNQTQSFANLGSWRWRIDTDELVWSDSIYEIFGLRKGYDQVSYKNFLLAIYPDDRVKVTKAIDLCIRQFKPYEVEHRIVLKNGKIKWVLEKGNVLRDEAGEAIEMYGIVRDVTDAKRAAEELSVSKDKYQLLAESGQELICLHSLDGRFLYASPSLKWLLGYDPKKIPDTLRSIDLVHPEDRESFSKLLADAIRKKGAVVTSRVRFRHQEGRYVCCEKNVRAMLDEKGKVVSLRSLTRNIEAQVQFENQLQDANSQLERTLNELKEASEAKENFLSVMSHEIRTPLNSVIGLSNVLIKRNPRPDQIEIVKTLKTSADNLMHLVNDILDFNKIRSGKVQLENQVFNLPEFLRQLYASHKLSAIERNLTLVFQVDPKIPNDLKGDVLRLNQVLGNLLGNALKFTHSGFVKLNAGLRAISDQACTICFEIKDSGVGIPADKHAVIFEPFRQSEVHTARLFGGTGLGLSIVKSLVELMGGNLKLKSVPGTGSIFSVEIKFERPNMKEAIKQVSQLERSGTIDSRSMEVLYVEDVESNRFLIQTLLMDNGMRCVTVSSGRAALRVTALKKFDVILMDIQMPGMDGYATTDKIRMQLKGKNRKTPIIAFTAEPDSQELRDRASKRKIQRVITKPFDTDQLLESLRKYHRPVVHKQKFCSFAFYEDVFDGKKASLKKIKKSVIADFTRFEKRLQAGDKAGDIQGIRREVHRIKPIVKNLACTKLMDLLEYFQGCDRYDPKVKKMVTRSRILARRLVEHLSKLKY